MKSRIGALAVIVLCTSCGGMSTPDRVTTLVATLNKAAYADCGQQRDLVARYLVTGAPTSLDSEYLNERTLVLQQPQGVQDAHVRQYVNDLVAQCDQTELAAIQAQQAAQQADADLVAYQAFCLRLGGTVASADGGGLVQSVRNRKFFWAADGYKKGQCVITYYVTEIGQSLTYNVPVASDGSFDRTAYSYNRDVRCKGHAEDFHSDTGVCVVVGFL